MFEKLIAALMGKKPECSDAERWKHLDQLAMRDPQAYEAEVEQLTTEQVQRYMCSKFALPRVVEQPARHGFGSAIAGDPVRTTPGCAGDPVRATTGCAADVLRPVPVEPPEYQWKPGAEHNAPPVVTENADGSIYYKGKVYRQVERRPRQTSESRRHHGKDAQRKAAGGN